MDVHTGFGWLYTEIPLDSFVVEANEIVAVFLIPIDYVSSI